MIKKSSQQLVLRGGVQSRQGIFKHDDGGLVQEEASDRATLFLAGGQGLHPSCFMTKPVGELGRATCDQRDGYFLA